MKNDSIIAAWNTIEPDAAADSRMLSAILSANRTAQNRKEKMNHMNNIKRILIPAAACLALLAMIGVVGVSKANHIKPENDAGTGVEGEIDIDGTVPGGSLPDGIDPIVASIAVFPGCESLSNVESATLNSISEEEARRVPELGEHLPDVIPEGYRFRHAGLYETTMQDGTVYRLLRVSYSFGENFFSDSPEDEPDTLDYSISLLNYEPETQAPVYRIESLPGDLSGKGFLYVVYGDQYVGIDVGDLSSDEIRSVLDSVH